MTNTVRALARNSSLCTYDVPLASSSGQVRSPPCEARSSDSATPVLVPAGILRQLKSYIDGGVQDHSWTKVVVCVDIGYMRYKPPSMHRGQDP